MTVAMVWCVNVVTGHTGCVYVSIQVHQCGASCLVYMNTMCVKGAWRVGCHLM